MSNAGNTLYRKQLNSRELLGTGLSSERCNCDSHRPWLFGPLVACFIVRDHGGQKLAYVYYEEEPGRRSAAKMLTKDEARRIAAYFAKLPELLKNK
jgi:hypothetical protein